MEKYYFTIKCEKEDKFEEIDFKLENDNGELSGESYNPVQMWTGYTHFDQGWSEMDPDLNNLLGAIKDYSLSEELIELLENNYNNLNKPLQTKYFCDGYVDENREYDFEVTIGHFECRDD